MGAVSPLSMPVGSRKENQNLEVRSFLNLPYSGRGEATVSRRLKRRPRAICGVRPRSCAENTVQQ